MHIGIDPGLRGAIVGLHADGSLALAWDMPTTKEKGKVVIDLDALADGVRSLEKHGIESLTIEKPFWKPEDRTGTPGKYTVSHQAQMKARVNSGIIMGMCKMVFKDIRLVEPAIWKRAVGLPVGSTKEASIKMACDLWTTARTKLCKDGRAEAALIAYCGYRHAKFRSTNLEISTDAQAKVGKVTSSSNWQGRYRR